MNVFQMSLNASALIIFVILIRAIAINYFPKKTFIALWGIVLARLIIPISIPLDFSLFKFMDIATDTKSLFLKNASDFIVPIINNELLHENSIANINASMNISQLFTAFWVLGIAISFIIFFVSYIRCYKNMMEALPINDNEFIREWLIKQNMKRKVVILISDRITTPITFGVITPKIVFPKTMDCSNNKQMDYVLSHELVHIKRFDNAWKFTSMIALCVHWFNPIVWIMCILFNRDLEIACDERVISMSGEGTKSDYALSLINLAQKKREFTPLYNGFGKNAIKERIECIMKFKKIPVLATVLSLTLIIGAGSVFATPKVNNIDNVSFSFKVDGVNEKNIVMNDSDFKYAEKINLDSTDKNSFFTFKSDIVSVEIINTYNFEELKKLIENLEVETDKLVKKGELTQEKADEAVNFYKKQIAELEKNGGIKIKASTEKDATEELRRLDELVFVLPANILAEVLKNTETLTFGIQIKEIGDWSDFSTSNKSFKK